MTHLEHGFCSLPRSVAIFMAFASGEMGANLLSSYTELLNKFPSLNAPDVSFEYFNICIGSMAECWRRLVLPTLFFPWKIFRLLSLDTDRWPEEISKYKDTKKACPHCVDYEFPTMILDFLDGGHGSDEDVSSFVQIERFLWDVATYAPISSDLVECMHGFAQATLHRFRGSKPSDEVAQERMVWRCVTRSYSKLRDFLWCKYGDRNMGHRIHRFGKRGHNQYTQQCEANDSCQPPERKRARMSMSVAKMDALLACSQGSSIQAPRKLAGDKFLFQTTFDLSRAWSMCIFSSVAHAPISGYSCNCKCLFYMCIMFCQWSSI